MLLVAWSTVQPEHYLSNNMKYYKYTYKELSYQNLFSHDIIQNQNQLSVCKNDIQFLNCIKKYNHSIFKTLF